VVFNLSYEEVIILSNLVENLSLEKNDRSQDPETLAMLNNHFINEVDRVCSDESIVARLHEVVDEDELEPRKLKGIVNANISKVRKYLRSL